MDYGCGLAVDRIAEPRKRRLFVALSMALNLGMLGYFKYFNFFAESLHAALARAGLNVTLAHLEVVLPIGISFYTFQSMSYVIDVYRRDIRPTRNLVEFAAFVSFFPHLVAGPIMRPTVLLPQVARPRRFNLQQFYRGSYLIFWGLTKKVVIADNLSKHIVEPLFNQWQTIDGGLAVVAIYAFAFQIYCDFSGYTDAARGIAKCLGFELALNFNLPYFATSPQDFWSRWHISLSTWLRDYLYIPLGGSRGSRLKLYRNLMLTMIIGGLWHGAAWTFVLWGTYQGLLLVTHRLVRPWLDRIRPTERVDRACWKLVRMAATFHMICLGWLLFRAQSLEQVTGMLRAIIERPAIPASSYLLPVAVLVLPLLLYQAVQHVSKDLDVIGRTPWYVRSVFYTACFYAFVLGGEFGGAQFIYFQF
jgi:D-alanyl-lipoteichoic acid acyltransferase DltB (MBOAT superfamily)